MQRSKRTALWGDDGVAMIIVGIMMVVLLAFVGLAVDVGLLYNERRQEQSAADTAALAAVQDDNWNDRIDTAFEVVNLSGDQTYTEADWNDPLKCPAADIPTAEGYTAAPGQSGTTRTSGALINSDCIAYLGNPADSLSFRLWVKVPTVEIDTVFAGLVGVDTLETSAFAVAGYPTEPPVSNFLPFSLSYSAQGNANAACIGEPPGGLSPGDICPGPNSGNFGDLDLVRPIDWGTGNEGCGNSYVDERIEINIIDGLDHELSERTDSGAWTGPSDTPDGPQYVDECTLPDEPNAVNTDTGANIKAAMKRGFLGASTYGTPRLRQIPSAATVGRTWDTIGAQFGTTTINGVDDMGLWEFIGTAGESFGGDWATWYNVVQGAPDVSSTTNYSWPLGGNTLPGICNPAVDPYVEPHRDDDSNGATPIADDDGVPGTDTLRSWSWNRDRMVHCLYAIDQSGASVTVFDADSNGDGIFDLEYSPRFTYIPEAWQDLDTYCSGNCTWDIRRFRPAYIDQVYFIKGNGFCVHNPGEGVPTGATCGSNGSSFRAATVLLFDVDDSSSGGATMLPDDLQDPQNDLEEPYPQLIR